MATQGAGDLCSFILNILETTSLSRGMGNIDRGISGVSKFIYQIGIFDVRILHARWSIFILIVSLPLSVSLSIQSINTLYFIYPLSVSYRGHFTYMD